MIVFFLIWLKVENDRNNLFKFFNNFFFDVGMYGEIIVIVLENGGKILGYDFINI